MSILALLFPGQGSQAVGMGRELAAAFPVAQATFDEADDVLGERLSTLCFEGPEAELTQTANTQPAILTASVAALRVLAAEADVRPELQGGVALGHSLGEFSALVAAGALRFADAVALVRLRGRAMQDAVAPGVGAMAAVVGLPVADVERLCAEASAPAADPTQPGELVTPANDNGGGQLVVAGHAPAVARLVELAKAHKARAIPLKVSAPFHCPLMAPAAQRLAAALAEVSIAAPAFPVIANIDAEPYPGVDAGLSAPAIADAVRDRLVRQVTGRVRWEASVQRAVALGATRAIELGHGRVLAGLVKRIAPAVEVRGLHSPADLDVIRGTAT